MLAMNRKPKNRAESDNKLSPARGFRGPLVNALNHDPGTSAMKTPLYAEVYRACQADWTGSQAHTRKNRRSAQDFPKRIESTAKSSRLTKPWGLALKTALRSMV